MYTSLLSSSITFPFVSLLLHSIPPHTLSSILSFLPHNSRNLSSPNPPSPSISLFLSPSLSLPLFLPSSLANMQMILCKNFHILNTARNANIIPYTRAYTSSSLVQINCATYALHSLLTYRMCIDIDRTTLLNIFSYTYNRKSST